MEMRNKKILIWTVIVLIVLSGIWKILKYSTTAPDKNTYQVVLLNNNQVFYGKLHNVYSNFPYLTDVYYLNAQAPTVDNKGKIVGDQGQKFTVMKRGIDEIHQPADKMYFEKSNIIYWENIGADSLVARGIVADKEYRAGLAKKALEDAAAKTEEPKAEENK